MSYISKKVRNQVFEKYNGKCAYCGCDLPDRWHIDHIEPVVRNPSSGRMEKPERDKIENYNPACPKCNINKHQMSIEQFRGMMGIYVESLNKYSVQYQMAKKFGLIKETEAKVIFYFEKMDALQHTNQVCTNK